ncbi:DUF4326 domain-containing protein [Vibrio splendidus]|uniref:DUF4326 domain-containing protein n=1 Tax=Vibrio splendidus TaxID=29497 RepID=UPI0021B16CEF|nr:DUF4326 domain-containing protein [Vibrio splendidus]UWZ99599.1 DUF4326 domain-containing protein [Vibrio splendidus]
MNTILILSPIEFTCFSKFSRKLRKIISSLTEVAILSPSNHHGFIERFSNDSKKPFNIIDNWKNSNFTHAVVFTDGEEFIDELEFIKSKGLPTRVITINITRVINIKRSDKYSATSDSSDFAYIGRGAYWGNPYSIFEVEDLDEDETPRDNVIRKFKYDFEHDCLLNRDKNEVFKLSGKRLGCYCKPEACHGDVIAEFLNSWDDGK